MVSERVPHLTDAPATSDVQSQPHTPSPLAPLQLSASLLSNSAASGAPSNALNSISPDVFFGAPAAVAPPLPVPQTLPPVPDPMLPGALPFGIPKSADAPVASSKKPELVAG